VRRGHKSYWVVVFLAFVLAAPMAMMGMYAAWGHTPSLVHEVRADGVEVVHWRALLNIGGIYFLPVFVTTCALGAIVRAAVVTRAREDEVLEEIYEEP
jgi:hypothetical protein